MQDIINQKEMDALNEIFNGSFYKDESEILKENIITCLSMLNNIESKNVLIFINDIISSKVVKLNLDMV